MSASASASRNAKRDDHHDEKEQYHTEWELVDSNGTGVLGAIRTAQILILAFCILLGHFLLTYIHQRPVRVHSRLRNGHPIPRLCWILHIYIVLVKKKRKKKQRSKQNARLTGKRMSASKYGDIITTHTNVPTNRKNAYIKRVDVDSLIGGRIEQQHRNDEPHSIYFNFNE